MKPNRFIVPVVDLDKELPIEYLRRLIQNVNYEPETLLQDLPSVQAIVEFFDLWEIYGTDFLAGIIECIEDGDDPKPYLKFVKKYKLPWQIKFEVNPHE
jgi:hypothetical protein